MVRARLSFATTVASPPSIRSSSNPTNWRLVRLRMSCEGETGFKDLHQQPENETQLGWPWEPLNATSAASAQTFPLISAIMSRRFMENYWGQNNQVLCPSRQMKTSNSNVTNVPSKLWSHPCFVSTCLFITEFKVVRSKIVKLRISESCYQNKHLNKDVHVCSLHYKTLYQVPDITFNYQLSLITKAYYSSSCLLNISPEIAKTRPETADDDVCLGML